MMRKKSISSPFMEVVVKLMKIKKKIKGVWANQNLRKVDLKQQSL